MTQADKVSGDKGGPGDLQPTVFDTRQQKRSGTAVG
jgi:hypothetical protein